MNNNKDKYTPIRQRLADLVRNQSQGPIASLYLPLQSEQPISSLINSIISSYKNDRPADLPPDYAVAVENLINDVRKRAMAAGSDGNNRTYVLFYGPNGIMDEFSVATAHEPYFHINDRPYLVPLRSYLGPRSRYLAIMVERERSHIYEYEFGRMKLLEKQATTVPQKVRRGSGSWRGFRSQPDEKRVDRHIQYHLNEFFKDISDRAFSLFNRGMKYQDYDHVLLGTHDPLMTPLENTLHPYLQQKVVGRFTVDLDDDHGAIQARVEEAVADYEKRREAQLISEIIENVSTDSVAVGSEDISKNITLGSVMRLVVNPGQGSLSKAKENEILVEALLRDSDIYEVKYYTNKFPYSLGAILRYSV